MHTPIEPSDLIEERFSLVRSLPTFGTLVLYAILVAAGITFALSLAAVQRSRLLQAARNAAYATCALIWFDLLLLAYAFITHDFRIRYVARYSDRSMPTGYLFTALWGGQDGSLLWWMFLLSLNTAVCVWWVRNKYRELQPYVIATLVSIIGFFAAIMAFSANPFAESIAGARVDGEGLNPLLQNFYMIIHPPSLYIGFVACSVPFAFGIGALCTGFVGEDWLVAVRKWILFAWLFLSIGNVLGMLWAYEELGWGGYWAWDPVENAAFMPWLTASAFVHSMMIQERRQILKVWNVVLLSTTFFMTIWGTFLTRSGMIASVHSFAQSNIGIYFTYFMVTIAVVVTSLIVYRLPDLKNIDTPQSAVERYHLHVGKMLQKIVLATVIAIVALRFSTPKMAPIGGLAVATVLGIAFYGIWQMSVHFKTEPTAKIDSFLSREAAFVANNWVLLGMQMFICLATAFPLISESITGEKVTVGPGFYNRWMVPLGLILFALMGIGPLLGWRKTSGSSLRKAFRIPIVAMLIATILHLSIGKTLGFPALVPSDPIYPGLLGVLLAKIGSIAPLVAFTLIVFNLVVIVQEYTRGIVARMRTRNEQVFTALVQLVAKSRRRYGGYIVHAGIAFMFFGFTGAAYKVDREFAVKPGETIEFEGYQFTYLKTRSEVDPEKRKIFVDVSVRKGERDLGIMSPAKFIYMRQQMPTTEVAIHRGARDDLYIAPGQINFESKLAMLHIYVNPLTSWIWLGVLILIMGSVIATWPEAALGEVGIGAYLRTAGATASALVLGLLLAMTPARASGQPSGNGGSSSMAGTVALKNEHERQLFNNLLCMCGGCERLPLSSCVCDWAENMRKELTGRLESGESIASISDDYVKRFGTSALNVPPSRGFLKSIWLVPSVLLLVGGAGAYVLVRRWTRTSKEKASVSKDPSSLEKDEYDTKLDAELNSLDQEAPLDQR